MPQIGSTGSEAELVALALGLAAAALAGAVWGSRRAPATSIGLVTGVVTGAASVWILSVATKESHGVPAVVLTAASAAFVASGLLAAMLLPAIERGRSLRPVIVALFLAAPLAGLATLLTVQHACPLYVTRAAGACFYEHDVLGGWSTGAAVLVGLDIAALAAMLLITELRAIDRTEVGSVLVPR
jgi:hypothetical protein